MKKPPYLNQNNIPSQAPSKRTPYDPAIQPDIVVTDEMRGAKPFGYPPKGVYTLSNYDARPPEAIDFYIERSIESVASGTPDNVCEQSFTVPLGRTLVLRSIGISMAMDPNNQDPTQPPASVSLLGFPTWNTAVLTDTSIPKLTMLIDGAPVPQYSDIALAELLLNTHHIPCYILARGGAVVTFRSVWSVPAAGDNAPHVAFFSGYGNLLLSKGTDIVNEPVNSDAVPVKAGFFGKMADALAAMAERIR